MKRLVLGAAILSLLAACGGQPSTSPGGGEAGGKPGKIQIAVIPKGLANQFWLMVKAGAEAGGKEFGAEIIWQGPAKETELEKQLNIVQDMISRRVSAMVLAACDEEALIGPIQQALSLKIPVITIDSGVKSDIPLSFVATDNVLGAKIAAETLAKLIGEEGAVGLIPHVPGAATSEMREEGFKQGIAAFPKIHLVATNYCYADVAKALDVAQDMLTAHPDIKGIFATCEAGAIGALQAFKGRGIAKTMKLVAFDASKEEVAELKDGAIHALIVQAPFKMGYLGVKSAIDALNGKPVEKRIDTGVTVVTPDNVNHPDIQKLLNPI